VNRRSPRFELARPVRLDLFDLIVASNHRLLINRPRRAFVGARRRSGRAAVRCSRGIVHGLVGYANSRADLNSSTKAETSLRTTSGSASYIFEIRAAIASTDSPLCSPCQISVPMGSSEKWYPVVVSSSMASPSTTRQIRFGFGVGSDCIRILFAEG